MLIRLTTLGAVRVFRDDTELPDLPAQRLRAALLLFLAVERDVSRDEVLGMFWPDRDAGRGKHALRQMLYELRQVLGDDWIEVRRDRLTVHASVDAADFEAAAAEGRTEEALRLYDGAFLLGFSLENRTFEGWADRRRAHLGRLHRRLEREHIAQLVAASRTETALAAARRWVELDPLDDEAVHTLIERLAAAGQRAAALQYFDAYERHLAAELQVEPLDETKALVAAIRNGEHAPAALPAPPERRELVAAQQDVTVLPAPSDPAQPARGPRAPWRAWSRKGRAAAGSAVVIALVLLIALVFRPTPSAPVAAAYRVRIAMLPLRDVSADTSLRPLANALTEELSTSLAYSPLLQVIPPSGVQLLRQRGTPEDRLGVELSADYLVGGTVSRWGNRVRVRVDLIDGRTGTVVRTELVERPWSESRTLVEGVVDGAAAFLRRELGRQVDIARVRAGTDNDAAWQLVIEAKAIQAPVTIMLGAHEFDAVERELARADSALAIAADLDRKWAEPLVMRGWVLERRAFIVRMPLRGDTAQRRQLLEAGLAMADRAAQRDSAAAGVHALRGALLSQLALLGALSADTIHSRRARAELELRRATELDPLNQHAWRLLADLQFTAGRYGEAKVSAQKAFRIDPFSREASALTYMHFATSFELGLDVDAAGWCSQGRDQFPLEMPFLYCLLALHAWGGPGVQANPAAANDALQHAQQAHLRNQPQLRARFRTMIAAAHARAGQPDSARAILRSVAADTSDTGLLWMRAAAHVGLREDSTAIALLRDYIERAGVEAQRVATSRPFWGLQAHAEVRRMIANATSTP